MIHLRQSTASQEVPLGHFVDDTDGVTAMSGLTIANTDIKVWKAGATTLANKNSGGATHISGGIYYTVLDATDTDTIGPLVLFVAVSGALAVRLECCVLDEAVYDVMYGTTAPATATNITAGTITTVTTVVTVTGLSTEFSEIDTQLSELSDQIDNVYARIGATAVTVTNPVADDGTTVTVEYGDDYYQTESRRITWNFTGQPDITDATAVTLITNRGVEITLTKGTTGSGAQSVYGDVSATQVNSLVGSSRYKIKATLNSHGVTIIVGECSVTLFGSPTH
jgi:hypothetical protein